MKNTSIRTRMLLGVVLLNVVGAVLVIIYLHQSFAGGLDVWAQKSLDVGTASWTEVSKLAADEYGAPTTPDAAIKYLDAIKGISGADYGLMMDKASVDQKAYEKALEAAGKPSNWNERDNYVMIATTADEAIAQKMQLKQTTASDVPEIGKVVGIENGSCTAICHRTIKVSGDFWKVSWSDDSNSRAHVVFPVIDKAGKPIGVIYSIENVTPQAENAKSVIYRTMIAIGLTLVIVTLVIGAMLDLWVFKRLNQMISSMEELSMRVAGGDFYAKYAPSGLNDEIGKFEKFFERFLDLMTATLRSLVDK
jgi:HAMP domain-containing protein